MKKTPLYDMHLKSGARMVEFAGFSMPVQYSSMVGEHLAVRSAAGIFDVSHMGEFTVSGRNSRSYIASLVPTSMEKLLPGKGMYTLFCNENGGVVDDLFVFMINSENYYLVVNASTVKKDFEWLMSHSPGEVTVQDVSEITAKIDIQGPRSKEIIQRVFRHDDVQKLNRFDFCYDEFSGEKVIVSNSGYTGEKGYEIFAPSGIAENLWSNLIEAGSEYGLLPAGLGARDTLRVEACLSLYGNEINESINPFEANLGWLINSDSDYNGKPALNEIKQNGPAYKQFCIELEGKGVPHSGFDVIFNGSKIGVITSGIYSPTFRKGLAIIRAVSGSLSVGDSVEVLIRGRGVPGRVVPRPFYRYNG